ncbi:CHAD domain-containing protein [Marinobacter sp. TBZ242]|uniref:CHAD domain-containing protein n=1 Tax=Marinobacter azerbaijanicus TaxID=3050455 RepID=A0ABT7IFB2_9GAMM|nr:CHAD domain-containing protein [Marinobacter sp. TBZ242]MDL0431819.1 CHAD domain-containing protein [Marinobacter sp. TBZ242]
MKYLYLIRHAKSSWADDSLRDDQRPLNSRGTRQLGAMGRAIRAAGVLNGPIFCSNATRARQTLDGLIPEDLRQNTHIVPELYTFNYKTLINWLRNRQDEDSITLIGHNPALEELASYLLQQAPDSFPTCAFMQIALPVKHWHKLARNKGRLEQFLTPKDVSYEQFNRKRKKMPGGNDTPLARHIPETLQHQYLRMRDLETGVIRGFDSEFLHQYRIAIRRSRAIAESVSEISGDSNLRKATRALKRHAQATSQLRDLHVLLADLERWQLEEGTESALISSGARSYFANLADLEHQALAKRLCSRKYQKDMDEWFQLITSHHFEKTGRKLTTGDIRKALDKRIKQHNAQARQLSTQSPDDDYHSLRKLLKRIRYLAELDKPAFRAMLRQLKQRQQRFGDFQDLHVQIEMLTTFRDGIATEPDMFEPVAGLNDLIAGLASEKAGVRNDILTLGGIDGHPVL